MKKCKCSLKMSRSLRIFIGLDLGEVIGFGVHGDGPEVRLQLMSTGTKANQIIIMNIVVLSKGPLLKCMMLIVMRLNHFIVWRTWSWSWCSRKVHGKRPCYTADKTTKIWPYWTQIGSWLRRKIRAQQPWQMMCGLVCALSLVTGFGQMEKLSNIRAGLQVESSSVLPWISAVQFWTVIAWFGNLWTVSRDLTFSVSINHEMKYLI